MATMTLQKMSSSETYMMHLGYDKGKGVFYELQVLW